MVSLADVIFLLFIEAIDFRSFSGGIESSRFYHLITMKRECANCLLNCLALFFCDQFKILTLTPTLYFNSISQVFAQ